MIGEQYGIFDYDDGKVIVKKIDEEFNVLEEYPTFNSVVDLLNNLHEENESLKEENKFLRNKVATYKSGNALLKKSMDKEWK